METAIDEGFIGRVYRTSGYLWAFGLLICFAFFDWRSAAGWSIGSATSLGILRSLEWIVTHAFAPGEPKPRRRLARFSIAKLAAVVAILACVVAAGGTSAEFIFAFCAGVVLTQTVIFLKVLGILISARANT